MTENRYYWYGFQTGMKDAQGDGPPLADIALLALGVGPDWRRGYRDGWRTWRESPHPALIRSRIPVVVQYEPA